MFFPSCGGNHGISPMKNIPCKKGFFQRLPGRGIFQELQHRLVKPLDLLIQNKGFFLLLSFEAPHQKIQMDPHARQGIADLVSHRGHQGSQSCQTLHPSYPPRELLGFPELIYHFVEHIIKIHQLQRDSGKLGYPAPPPLPNLRTPPTQEFEGPGEGIGRKDRQLHRKKHPHGGHQQDVTLLFQQSLPQERGSKQEHPALGKGKPGGISFPRKDILRDQAPCGKGFMKKGLNLWNALCFQKRNHLPEHGLLLLSGLPVSQNQRGARQRNAEKKHDHHDRPFELILNAPDHGSVLRKGGVKKS